MKRLDHSMIFVLIAASYTPITLLVLRGAWSVVILSVIWSMAAIGIALKLARVDGLKVQTGILYMSMGWLALVPLWQIFRGLSLVEIVLLVAGGLLYTVGAIIFASRRPDPDPEVFGYHEVWHSLLVAAAACHWSMIFLIVRAAA